MATLRPSHSMLVMHSYGQLVRHAPLPVHLSGSTRATSGSSSANPFLSSAADWATAASPAATLSPTVRGLWQQPAIITPSTTVSTGRSLGWISLKLPIGTDGFFNEIHPK